MATAGEPDYVQAGHDEVLGQIDDASEPHAPIEEENAVGNCIIPSNSSQIMVGDSVYVNERDCKELRAVVSELRNRAEAAEQQIEKERGEKDEQIVQKTRKLREVTEELEKTKQEYESSTGVFLTLKKRLESEHAKQLDEVTKVSQTFEQKLALKDEDHAQQLALKEKDLEKKLSEKEQHLERQLSEKEQVLEKRLTKRFDQQLSDEAKQSKQQQAQKDEELREATHKLETCREQLKKNKKQLADAHTNEEQLKSDNADLKKQVEDLTTEKEALEKTVKELGEEVRVLNQQMGELQTTNKELQEKMDKCIQKEDLDKAIDKAIQKSEEQNREEMARTRKENARITTELIQAKNNMEQVLKLVQESALSGKITKQPELQKTMTKSSSTSNTPPSN